MLAFLIIAISTRMKGAISIKEETTFSVKTFYDYTVDMKDKGAVANFEVPKNTFILISSIDGYTAVVEKPESESINIKPDQQNRLIYFKDAGTLKITSTISDYKFTFHSLPLDIFDGETLTNSYLIVSTDPKEMYRFISDDLKDQASFYNSTFSSYNNEKVLLWFISDKRTEYIVDISTESQVYYATTAKSHEDESKISLNQFNDKNNYFESQSKLFIIPTGQTDAFKGKIDIYKSSKYQEYTYIYTSFRLFTQISSLETTCIVERGKYHTEENKIEGFPKGIFDIDFSIPTNYLFRPTDQSIFIFPYKSSLKVDSYEDIFGFVHGGNEIKSHTLSTSFSNTNEETSFKVIRVKYPTESGAKRYIISTSPVEKLIIGDEDNRLRNYTNNDFYVYIMASLQDIKTSVICSGNVGFYKLRYQNDPEIDVTQSGQTIKGPFIAIIPKGAAAYLYTSPVEELKEGFEDNFRVTFKDGTTNALFSKKYGSFFEYDATEKKNSIIDLSYVDACKIFTFNLIYIQEQERWWGEILSPKMPDDDNKIGPHLKRTKFYTYNENKNAFYNEIMVCKTFQFDDMSISLTTHCTESFPHNDIRYYCDKYLVINKVPSLYIISSDEGELQLTGSQNLCILPVFSPVFFGSYISNNNDANVNVINTQGVELEYTDTVYDDSLSEVVTKYKNYGYSSTLIKVTKRKTTMDVIAAFTNYTRNAMPDEPEFFSLFEPNTTHGIHVIENKQDDSGGSGDGDDDEEGDIEYNIEKINGYKIVDMTKKSLTIQCPKTTIFFIHHIGDCVAEAFSSSGEKFATINKESNNRIINFGGSDGVIKINKIESTNIELIEEKDYTVHYSYLLKEKIKNITPYSIYCNEIFISSNPNSYVKISDPSYKLDKNFTVPVSGDFCLWFSSPIELESLLIHQLPHRIYLYNNGEGKEISELQSNNFGYDFLYLLKSVPVVEGNYKYDIFTNTPRNSNEDSSSFEYDWVDKKYSPSNDNCVFDSQSYKPTPTSKKNDNTVPIIIAVVVIVVIVVIIIVVVVVCVKKKKKNAGSSAENEASV